MHRFGRSAQKKMNDRWGGAFILAVVLAVVGAWQLGSYLGALGNGKKAASEPSPGMGNVAQPNGAAGSAMAATPHEFQIHFIQVGAFRSEGTARNLAKDLSAAGYAATVTPKDAKGLAKVYAGPYMSATEAADAKSRMTAENLVESSFNVAMTVEYKPGAVTAMAGSANSDLQRGLDAMNTYLYEAGNWYAARAAGQPADGTFVALLGQEMSRMASTMGKADSNPAVAHLLTMATAASENAAAIETAATAKPDSDEFQTAMNGYVSLLNQYRSFHTQSAGN
jgi:hypothetical protein